jgi:hypothetical protein
MIGCWFSTSAWRMREPDLDAVQGGGVFGRCGRGVLGDGESRGQGKRDADGQDAALHSVGAECHLSLSSERVSCALLSKR